MLKQVSHIIKRNSLKGIEFFQLKKLYNFLHIISFAEEEKLQINKGAKFLQACIFGITFNTCQWQYLTLILS